MLEGNEEARRGRRLKEQLQVIERSRHKKRAKWDNVHRLGTLQ